MVDVQRLLEKYYADIRHIETERHWFLAAYAVVVAGTLAFLAQSHNQFSFLFGFGVLIALTIIGLLQSFRSAWTLEVVQTETREIVQLWMKNTNMN